MSFENRGKACEAQVDFTTRSGTVRRMDWGSLEKTQFQTTISMERCNQLLIRLCGCSIFFNRNMWFRVVEIKTKQGFQ
jgi:hypothetical protein